MKVLVIGRARTVWDEVTAAKAMTEFDKVVVVNVAGQDYPGRIDYWVSFHPGFFGIWIDKRKKAGHPYSPGQPQLWSSTHNGRKLAEQFKEIAVQHTNHMGGSSGLLGAWVAREVAKGDKIVLCGIPMENTPRYDDRTVWREALVYRQAWIEAFPKLLPYVRSMSGWTREKFGEPDKEWLEDVPVREESSV